MLNRSSLRTRALLVGSAAVGLFAAGAWAQPVLSEIPLPAGSTAGWTWPVAPSADGGVVALSDVGRGIAYRWTVETGAVPLPSPPSAVMATPAYGLSRDGSMMGGSYRSQQTGDTGAVLWHGGSVDVVASIPGH